MTVTVYSLPNCPQCDATKRRLTKLGVDYKPVNLADHPETAESFKAAGYYQAPIVTAGDATWSGYRPDKIQGLANIRKDAA